MPALPGPFTPGAASTSITSGPSPPRPNAVSYVVTFSTWYSPLRLTELLSPKGKTWKRKMNTLPQNGVSSARERRRRRSLQLRKMTSLVLPRSLGVMVSRRDSRKSKTLRQPAMVWLSRSSSTSQNKSNGSHSSLSARMDRMSSKFQTRTKSGESIAVFALRSGH